MAALLCAGQTQTPPAPPANANATPTDTAAPNVALTVTLPAGTTTITGTSIPSSAIKVMDLASNSPLALQGNTTTATSDEKGAFTLTLASPLTAGQKLQFQVQTGKGGDFKTATIGGDPKVTEVDISVDNVTIIGRITEGTTVVSGVTTKGTTVEIKDTASKSLLTLQGGGFTAPADKTSGAFSLALADPLYAGQKVQFLVQPASGGAFAAASIGGDASYTEMEIRALGDWGLVRAYFAFGTVLSFNNNFALYSSSGSSSTGTNSSQATLFLDFKLDHYWSWKGLDVTAADATGAKQPDGGQVKPSAGTQAKFDLRSHVMFATFFETRLTSVPVSICQSTTPTAPAPTSSSLRPVLGARDSGTTSTSTSSTGSSDCSSSSSGPDTLTTFLNSAKSAEVMAGVYLPILTRVWAYQGAPNALFIGPVARVGFIAPTGSTTSGSNLVQPVNPANFYNFYAFGGRIGHLKLTTDPNTAPEALSYLDVVAGRFSNLETLMIVPASTAGGATTPNAVRRVRIMLEGELKVPSTPLVFGVYANIGQNLNGKPTALAAKDDLRFFIGARFDVGRLMAKLPQL